MRRGARHPGCSFQAGGRYIPADICDVRGTGARALEFERLHGGLRSQRHVRVDQARVQLTGELLFLGCVADATHFRELRVHRARKRFVRQQAVNAVDHFVVHRRSGTERSAFGGFDHAIEHFLDDARVQVTHVVIGLREVGHDIGGRAAARDHVVDSRIGRHMLAHHVDHVVHRLDGVERGASAVRRTGCVRGNPVEAEFHRLVGERLVEPGGIDVGSVPVQNGAHIAEEARAYHVDLAAAAFFRGRAVEPDRAGRAALLQPVLECDCRGNAGRAKEMMTAGMSGEFACNRLAQRRRVLRDTGQRIVFGKDADHGVAFAPARDECGRHAGNTRIHLESRRGQLLLQQGGTLRFLVADFGPVPDRLGDFGIVLGTTGQELADCVIGLRGC